jgi:hypothetical protein
MQLQEMPRSDKDVKVKMFCKLFDEFLTDVGKIYPGDMSLKFLHTACNLIVAADPYAFVLEVMSQIGPYSKEILARDEAFFKNEINNFRQDESTDYIFSEMQKVRDIWMNKETSDNTKECIWKYFTLFVKLGDSILTSR